MAIRIELDNGDNRGRVDYTRYLQSPSQSPVVMRDRVNLPALLDFSLVPADDDFLVPRRGAYVRLTGLADALPAGGPRVPGPLFTGYITNEPAVEFLGTRTGKPVYGYRFQATSEEYLLNIKRIGIVPPFLNQTAGQILIALVELLQPGRFDTTEVSAGPLIPVYQADPEKSWGEVARELSERNGFQYRVLDGKLIFQPLNVEPAGVTVSEHESRFRPESLEITPLGNPVRNDVSIFAEIEPQAYVTEYFAGDGFTSHFVLSAPVFGAEPSLLLADDFTRTAVDTAKWKITDPDSNISLFQGSLNVTGGTGSLGETTLVALQSIELNGELEFIHGEFEFVATSSGILGGLYSAPSYLPANCLLGFDVSPIGGGSRIRALVNSVVQPQEVLVQPGYHYILATRLSADVAHRTQQTFSSLTSSFGGASVAANIRVVLEVHELSIADPALVQTTVLLDSLLTNLPPFAAYVPVNSADLHAVANFLQVSRPIQARLESTPPAGAPRARKLGFGIAGQDATITSDPNQNQWALDFYEDTIPARGELITLRYRAAGRARARVRDAASVAVEQAVAGDDGVRAAVLSDLSPAPRTSKEAELAALAFLDDNTKARYEGRYTTWGEFCDAFPRAGRLLAIEDESRYPAFTALVRNVTSEFLELATERIQHTLEFGQASQFEDMLRQFSPQENVLAPQEASQLAATEIALVGQQYLPDVPGGRLSAFTATHSTVDMSAPPSPGVVYEVRRSDRGWATPFSLSTSQNVVGTFTTQSFVLARTARNQSFFIRPVDGSGMSSRFSSVIAVHYPLPPAQPQALNITHTKNGSDLPVIRAEVVLADSAIADVDRVELRDADNVTVLAVWEFSQLTYDGSAYRAALEIDNSTALERSKTLFAYAQNILGEYSVARTATAAKPEPLKPSLAPGNSVGQILEVQLDRIADDILETEVQVIEPGGSFTSPIQSVSLAGQPEKFYFVATSSGEWTFRARRRDALGWSPWSNEQQGQIPPETTIFSVQFFQARELDPSIGAAINSQNLLPNSDFFLPGISGQEGTAAARYFALVNAAASGTEVTHVNSTNEMKWNAGVNFANADPGFRALLSNLGRALNPGEAVTFSAALRHTGTGGFPLGVRLARRSASTPSYDQSSVIPAGGVTENFRWFSVTFTLPAAQAVPADLSFEVSLVIASGQSLSSALLCDKVILNRGHRPAAHAMALWDLLPLNWNGAATAYDLPATALAATQRSTDAGNAGLLAGTGTEDLDPAFAGRFSRFTV
jgi:hypothetical protein